MKPGSIFTTLWAISADDKYIYNFFQKTGFDILCKLSPLETIFTKCQDLFSEKKYFSMSAESFAQSGKR